MLITSKPIILDTSTWNYLIKKGNLKESIKAYYLEGFIPLLTLHNIKELLNYNNESERKQRLIELENVDYYYKFKNVEAPPSCLYLTKLEFDYILQNNKGSIDYLEMEKFVNENLELVDGKKLLGDLYLHTEILSRHTNKNEAGKFFSSVPSQLHSIDYDPNTKLNELNIPNNFESAYIAQKEKIKENIIKKGDKKKQHLVDQIDGLLDKVFADINNNKNKNKIEFFSSLSGLEPDEISLDMTFKEYLDKMELYSKLKNIASIMGIEYKTLASINYTHVPTLNLDIKFQDQYKLELIKDKPRRAEASIHEDRYLSFFSLYWNVIVDSRTRNILDKIKGELPLELKYKLN